jgi:3-hydroxyacyl-CoA dehydrogenase
MIKRIAVVGPGLMGLGIAQVAAAAGIGVVLAGRDAASAMAGHKRLALNLQRQVARGRLEASAAETLLRRVEPAQGFADIGACELAVEAVAEDREVKGEVLLRMQSALEPGSLIASNTSGLPITGLAAVLRRPERFIGLHFFSPVERMPLVEVVRGQLTAQATVREALAFIEQIGQRPIVVRDGPGFFTSRVFAAYLDEAMAMVGEGVSPQAVEQAGLAAGRAIGPLAVIDDISLQLNWQQARQARADGAAERFCRPLAWPVLDRMIGLKRGGRRYGGGFYDHPADGNKQLWPGLGEHFTANGEQPGLERVTARLRCAEAMEALRCLEEGVVINADDADTGSLLGLGFPAATGGVLRWVESQGLDRFVQTCRTLAEQHGPRFEPSTWLREVAAGNKALRAWRTNQ